MFYIINETDKPCQKLLVMKLADGSGKYLDKKLRNQYHFSKQQMDNATPLLHFGMECILFDDFIAFDSTCQPVATYQKDKRLRHWQGSSSFTITPYDIIDGTEFEY